MFFDFYFHSFLSSFSFSSVVLFFNFVVFLIFLAVFLFLFVVLPRIKKKNKNSSKNVHALFLVFFHFLL